MPCHAASNNPTLRVPHPTRHEQSDSPCNAPPSAVYSNGPADAGDTCPQQVEFGYTIAAGYPVGTKVTLRGPVKTEQERSAIELRARQTAGVTDVDNQIEVKK